MTRHVIRVCAGTAWTAVHWSLTVRALPTQVSGLAFAKQWVTPGTADAASFSVSRDTTLTGYIRNAAGQVIDHIGTWSLTERSSSMTWDARTDSGANPPDGTYFLHLDTSDGTAAETSIHIDSTSPVVQMTSPGTIKASQVVSFLVGDARVGTHSVSASIDGQHRNVSVAAGRFSISPNGLWAVGRHSWSVTATDRLGNARTFAGRFSIPAPPTRQCGDIRHLARHIRAQGLSCSSARKVTRGSMDPSPNGAWAHLWQQGWRESNSGWWITLTLRREDEKVRYYLVH